MTRPHSVGSDTELQVLVDRRLAGDDTAEAALIDHACDRLLRLTRKMFHANPKLRRWEQTDDVFQNAMVRFQSALAAVQVNSVRQFFNLAATQIRRELVDLARHYYGPLGPAAHHHTDGAPPDDRGGVIHSRADEPQDLHEWSEFHLRVERLDAQGREVVNLLFYEGLTQEEASRVLKVSLRTFKRRWQATRLKLHEGLTRDGR